MRRDNTDDADRGSVPAPRCAHVSRPVRQTGSFPRVPRPVGQLLALTALPAALLTTLAIDWRALPATAHHALPASRSPLPSTSAGVDGTPCAPLPVTDAPVPSRASVPPASVSPPESRRASRSAARDGTPEPSTGRQRSPASPLPGQRGSAAALKAPSASPCQTPGARPSQFERPVPPAGATPSCPPAAPTSAEPTTHKAPRSRTPDRPDATGAVGCVTPTPAEHRASLRLAEGVWTLNSPRLVLLGGVFRGVVTVESAGARSACSNSPPAPWRWKISIWRCGRPWGPGICRPLPGRLPP